MPLDPLATHSAFDDFYGLRLVSCDEQGVVGELSVQPHHLQPTKVVHGGVYAAIGEALASFGTNWHVLSRGEVALGMSNATIIFVVFFLLDLAKEASGNAKVGSPTQFFDLLQPQLNTDR